MLGTNSINSLVQLDFDLNFQKVVLSGKSIRDAHYDLHSNILYAISSTDSSVLVYNVQNETIFSYSSEFPTSSSPCSIAFNTNDIYLGDWYGKIFIYDLNSKILKQTLENVCPTSNAYVYSINFDYNSNQVYSCNEDSLLKIKYRNGTVIDKYYSARTYGVLLDSKNRLWVSVNGKLMVNN